MTAGPAKVFRRGLSFILNQKKKVSFCHLLIYAVFTVPGKMRAVLQDMGLLKSENAFLLRILTLWRQ